MIELRKHVRFGIIMLGVVCAGISFSGGIDGLIAIKAGHIVTVTEGIIEGGTVLIRDGIIEAVGDVEIPPGAEIIVEDTMYVYPGLIDAHGKIALAESEEKEKPKTSGSSRRSSVAPSPLLCPEKLTAEMLDPKDGKIEGIRNTGVTTVLTTPDRGVFIGQSCLINLAGERPGPMILKSPVALHMGYTNQPGTYPSTLMGVIAYQRQTFLDAQHHRMQWDRYNRHKRGFRRPEPNASLDALVPVLEGTHPVVIAADTENQIKRVKRLSDEFGLSVIPSGVVEGWRVVDLLADWGRPVLVSMNFPEPDKVTGHAFKLEVEEIKKKAEAEVEEGKTEAEAEAEEGKTEAEAKEKKGKKEDPDQVKIFGNAAALHEAGVRFALTSFGMKKPQEFLKNVAKAVEHGLPAEVALDALTIIPAEIFGVAEQVGSIEEGKIANLIVTTGPLFEEKSAVKYVFVDGGKFLVEKPKKAKGGAKVDVTGVWSVKVQTSMGEMGATMSLTQSGSTVTGEYHSDMGNSPILDGSVSGQEIVFGIKLSIMGRETELVFSGSVEGESMSGTLNLGSMGTAEWEAEKSGPGR